MRENPQIQQVNGTKGYSEVTQQFIEATKAISFEELHQSIIPFISTHPSRILDVGAGIGRDASVFAEMGHDVVAVEPTAGFLVAAKTLYSSSRIEWLDDSLPMLCKLGVPSDPFDFILASAVWHHLDETERQQAMNRITQLLRPNGVFALSLRHGPAGIGTHVFPTDGAQTVKQAEAYGLTPLLYLPSQPSLMPNKSNITWTRLVFAKS